jgi:hypothetical protein
MIALVPVVVGRLGSVYGSLATARGVMELDRFPVGQGRARRDRGYTPATPEEARRHDVKPGLTDRAQIRGRQGLDFSGRFTQRAHTPGEHRT